MNINSTVVGLTDELSDYVGLKSGLIVTSADVIRLLDRDLASTDESAWYYSPRDWLHEPAQRRVRIRAENLESLVMRLLYSVGALPSPLNQNQLIWAFAADNPEVVRTIPSFPDEAEFPLPVTPVVRLSWLLSAPMDPHEIPSELADLAHDFQRRSIVDLMFRTQRISWDGAVPLSELFDLGEVAKDVAASQESMPLIDQRFIDYLHAQQEDLSQMHWRQFELLVGEFFRRHGYHVTVTPPTRDGGVDVRAIRETGVAGPELVLVQAKRFSDNRQVGIETVKALWSDVNEAAATRGVVATTSTLAAGALAYCQARRYRLTAAERPMVEYWLRALATYPR
ncbi:restriction endonuclease [Amycolatopsis alkalitolerans]|uniref:Restriction endonuclease n=1 Tax=Amycolatopsis alkalitolerans TaxID=2547244 RepID=A0A5C4LQK7_9PSEU|nr:restriction endonuclease [Amycolatopsis alkalitolerans]TNC19409.1 restriction endonuclease [Amycolatopsis alkalitolerans]